MDFLAPGMLLGTLAAAVPVVIHLIGRRSAPVRKFAALDFLLGSDKRVARRLRVRELVLLSLRSLACLVIPLVLAKPLLALRSGAGPVVMTGPQAAVLLVDDSVTMRLSKGGESLFDKARREALRVLDAMGGQAEVAIVLTSTLTPSGEGLVRDHARLRRTLRELEPSYRAADLGRAITEATALLRASPQQRRQLFVFSSGARAAFTSEIAPADVQGTNLQVVELGTDKLANAAIISARAEREPELGARGVRILAEIANYGPEPIVDRQITLWLAGRAVSKGLVTAEPGQVVSKRFSTTLPEGARGVDVELRLEEDALPVDDRVALRVELGRQLAVLLVNGAPRTVRHQDELFYLSTALKPGERAEVPLLVERVTPEGLTKAELSRFDVVFLANVPALEMAQAERLNGWVRAGGGLFVSVGDNVDAAAYALHMSALLPQPLQGARDESRGAGGGLALGGLANDHPIFAVFTEKAEGLRAARFSKLFLLTPQPETGGRRILARFSGGAPALVEAPSGEGRLMLFTSTLDRDWTDMPIHQGYLPFIHQVTHYLARVPAQREARPIFVGQSFRIPLPPGDVRAQVTAPGGRSVALSVDEASPGTVQLPETDAPGLYRVASGPAQGTLRPRPEATFAVNIDPRSSDVRPAAPLPAAASEPAQQGGVAMTQGRRVELWHALAGVLLIFLLAEGLLTRRA